MSVSKPINFDVLLVGGRQAGWHHTNINLTWSDLVLSHQHLDTPSLGTLQQCKISRNSFLFPCLCPRFYPQYHLSILSLFVELDCEAALSHFRCRTPKHTNFELQYLQISVNVKTLDSYRVLSVFKADVTLFLFTLQVRCFCWTGFLTEHFSRLVSRSFHLQTETKRTELTRWCIYFLGRSQQH